MDIKKYVGTWYEQYHIPQWFDPPGGMNTKAEYEIIGPNLISVTNSVEVAGRVIESKGKAIVIEEGKLCVSFNNEANCPNYIIHSLLIDDSTDEYLASVVTSSDGTSLYVLTREKIISVKMELLLLQHISASFDLDRCVRIVQT